MRGAFFLLPVLSCAVLALKRNQKKDLAQEVEAEFSDGEGNVIWVGTVLAVFFVMLVVFSMRWKIPYTAGSNNYETVTITWGRCSRRRFPL